MKKLRLTLLVVYGIATLFILAWQSFRGAWRAWHVNPSRRELERLLARNKRPREISDVLVVSVADGAVALAVRPM